MNKTTIILVALVWLPLASPAGESFSDDAKACEGGALVDRAEAFLADPGEMESDDGFLAYQYCTYCYTYFVCGQKNKTQGRSDRRRFEYRIKSRSMILLCNSGATAKHWSHEDHELLKPEFSDEHFENLAICVQE